MPRVVNDARYREKICAAVNDATARKRWRLFGFSALSLPMPIRRISAELIDEVCGSIASLAVLNLSHNDICTIENLERLSASLTRLDLSHNGIAHISGLDTLRRLTHLSLGSNRLRLVTGLEHLRTLETLGLEHNLLEAHDDVRTLAWMPALRTLTLAGNPLASVAGHRAETSRLLPCLLTLDGEDLRADADAAAADTVPKRPLLHPPSRQRRTAPQSLAFDEADAGRAGAGASLEHGARLLRMSAELRAAQHATELEALQRRAALASGEALLGSGAPRLGVFAVAEAHPATGVTPCETRADAETVARLRADLEIERRSHAATRVNLAESREQERRLAEAHAHAQAEAADAAGQLAGARAEAEAERISARQLRAYVASCASATCGSAPPCGSRPATCVAAGEPREHATASATASATKEGAAAREIEALRVEKELLQLRLEAMTELLQLQEEAIGAASREAEGGKRSGDASGGASDVARMHPEADVAALHAMVHGWRQVAFQQLLRDLHERRARQRAAEHLEAELRKVSAQPNCHASTLHAPCRARDVWDCTSSQPR